MIVLALLLIGAIFLLLIFGDNDNEGDDRSWWP